jgi:tetratricopeptide (TPR) repeat protein
VSSLAQVHLGAQDWSLAEEQSRHALELLEGRPDFLDEIGNAHIVLGRALLEQGRLDEAEQAFAEAELNLSQLSSASHRAVAWTAQGDLASRRGDDSSAAALYRRAAEALQDVRF